jgi:ABC-type transport system involved in Fe-S cluster assembly fused permease/ATPase subunit
MSSEGVPDGNPDKEVSWAASYRALLDATRLIWAGADRYAKGRLLIALSLVTAAAVLATLTPIALRAAIDSLSMRVGERTVAPILLVIAYVAGQYLVRCFTELRLLGHGQAVGRVYRRIGLRLFDHLLRLPMSFHLDSKSGAVAQTAQQGLDGCEVLLHNVVFTVLPVVIECIGVTFVLIHFEYPIYLGILAFAAVAYLIVFERGAKGVQEPAYRMSAARIDANAALTDSLLNFEIIKYYDAERLMSRRYDRVLSDVEDCWRQLMRQNAMNGLWAASVFALTLGASLTCAAYQVAQGSMTLGDFVLVNAYIMRLVQPLEMLGFALREIAQGVAFLRRLLDLMRQGTEADSPNAHESTAGCGGELKFESIDFAYRPERQILRGVSFVIPPGRTLAVVGDSGAGKSSLIRLLFRLYQPDSGRIVLDGTPISQLSLSALRSAIAVVPQDTLLLHDTIAANIAFGNVNATRAAVEEAARIANLCAFVNALPDGYDTLVGERGLKLSGGERQRVAIARAVLKRPRLFVFDEATSSLDSRSEREILRNLSDVATSATTLVIAHRLSTIVHADEIVVLRQGEIVERGAHADLVRRAGYYSCLWQAQQGMRAQGQLLDLLQD